jgi:DNA topoisomerase-1
MVVEKEREIRAFDPKEYWLIPGVFTTNLDSDYSKQWLDFINSKNEKTDNGPTIDQQTEWLSERNGFEAEISKVAGEKFGDCDEQKANQIAAELNKANFEVIDLETKDSTSRPSPPFITSTLQQSAANRLGFTTKRTMRVAQQLYEGIDMGSMGSLGLITYMRTDSTHISPEALSEVRAYIERHIGKDYLPEKPNFYAAGKDAQQAHEAIRVTDPDLKPKDIKQFLNDEQYKLYDLIWRRFVASQMQAAKWKVTTVTLAADTPLGTCEYRTTGRILVFDGFSKIWQTSSTQQQLPSLKVGQNVKAIDITAEQHFTKPPARYNEASLVKALEKEGIGRPSTYASIISTIQDRGYVEQREKKFFATDLGEVVTEKLDEFFPKIMDLAFTRYMEGQLDKIEENHLDWVNVLDEFYGPFKTNLEKATEQMKHAKAETTDSEYNCPDCGKKLVYRFGKNGKFLSCSAYPDCKFASPCDKDGKMVEQLVSEHKCPNCGKDMIVKNGRFGSFLGCSDYPNCKTILNVDKEGNVLPPKAPPQPTGIKCYKCKTGELVIRQSKKGPFLGCNKFPKCRTIISHKELDRLKEMQKQGQWPPDSFEKADEILGRKKTPVKKTAKKKTTKSKI